MAPHEHQKAYQAGGKKHASLVLAQLLQVMRDQFILASMLTICMFRMLLEDDRLNAVCSGCFVGKGW